MLYISPRSIKYRVPVGALLGVGLTLLASWLVVQVEFTIVLFAIVLVPAVVLIASNSRAALILITLSVFSLEYLAGLGLLPTVAVWALDGLLVLLFLRVLLLRGHTTGWFVNSPVFKLLVIWLILILLSGLVNGSSALQIILGSRAYIRFAVLYFCLLEFEWSESFLKFSLKLSMGLIVLQIPIALYQKFSGFGIDAVSGSIAASGGTGLLGVVALGGFSALGAYALIARRPGALLLAMGLLVLPALATARAFLFITPAVVIYLIVRLKRYFRPTQIALVLGLSVLILFNWSSLQGQPVYRDYSVVEVLRNPNIYINELLGGPVSGTQGASIGRFTGLQLAWQRTASSAHSLLFGFGPAAAQGSRFASLQSSLYEDLALSGGRASQLSRSLLEWGILGTLAYSSLFLTFWWYSDRVFRYEKDPFWKASAFAHALFCLVCLVLSVYTSTWSATSTAFLFWFTGGIVHRRFYSSISYPTSI